MRPIGFVRRSSPDEDMMDGSLVSRIVLDADLCTALDGIEDYSHIHVIYWLHKGPRSDRDVTHLADEEVAPQPLGVLATRVPVRPNPIDLQLVELVAREANVLAVRGLDALDGTSVLDMKPYPECVQGRFIVVTDFRVPQWLTGTIA